MSIERDQLDKSINRYINAEYFKVSTYGFAAGKQGLTLCLRYEGWLATIIAADRKDPRRNKTVWGALKSWGDQEIAFLLLGAGVNVCADDRLGVDDDGHKTQHHMATFIGRCLGRRHGELCILVGLWGIEQLRQLPVFSLDDTGILTLPPTDDLHDFLDGVLCRGVRANPYLIPNEAVPWTQVRTGGLPTDHWADIGLCNRDDPKIESVWRAAIAAGKMDKPLAAVNALQDVYFCINRPMLKFILADPPPPPKGERPKIWHKQYRAWQRAYNKLNTYHVATVTAGALVDSRFRVPLEMDFRGRIYGMPHFNFAREDLVRSLFLLADGEPIGEDGLRWLKGHVAACANGNSWSPVKKPGVFDLERRVRWTDENLQLLCEIGNAVLAGDPPKKWDWVRPSDPYQFFAACAELAQAVKEGPTFVTRLPITLDATNSGLQHLCRMTRASEGRYVNLTDAEEADDFYQRLAHAVWDRDRDLMGSPTDRELVKQPAMSYFYGAGVGGFVREKDARGKPIGKLKPVGMVKQILDVLWERARTGSKLKAREKAPAALVFEYVTEGVGAADAKQLASRAIKLARLIHEVIETMVPSAKAVMDFTRALAAICAAHGKSLRWPTPDGLQVINRYHERETRRYVSPIKDRRRRITLVVRDKPEIDTEKATSSAPANFTHSMDAAYLRRVVLVAAKEGIDLATIHDCIGCLAPRTSRLYEIAWEEMRQMYKRHNVLNELRESARRELPKTVELPPLPKMGSLDLGPRPTKHFMK